MDKNENTWDGPGCRTNEGIIPPRPIRKEKTITEQEKGIEECGQ